MSRPAATGGPWPPLTRWPRGQNAQEHSWLREAGVREAGTVRVRRVLPVHQPPSGTPGSGLRAATSYPLKEKTGKMFG